MSPDTALTLILARVAVRDIDPTDESSMRAHVMAYGDADAAGIVFA